MVFLRSPVLVYQLLFENNGLLSFFFEIEKFLYLLIVILNSARWDETNEKRWGEVRRNNDSFHLNLNTCSVPIEWNSSTELKFGAVIFFLPQLPMFIMFDRNRNHIIFSRYTHTYTATNYTRASVQN